MSLLTKEQQKVVEAARATIREDEAWGGRSGYEASLVAIIDDLQARAPKQYTEQELRQWAKEKGMSAAFCFAYTEGAVECARFIGALKAEP